MSLAVKVDIKPKSFRGIAKKRQAEIKAGIKLALSRTAQVGINIIQDRTAKGDDINGQRFERYSKYYAIAKIEGWPKSKDRSSFSGDASGIVNLNVTGKMTGGMTSKANSSRAVIFFTNPKITERAMINNKTRAFFGFNRLEEKQLAKTFERFLP